MRLIVEPSALDPVRIELSPAEFDVLTERIGLKKSTDPALATATLEAAAELARLGRFVMESGFDLSGHPAVPFIDARQYQSGDRLFGVPVAVKGG